MSSTAAPANARRNSFLLAISAKETIRLVTEVPMLAPIMIGIAMPTVKTIRSNEINFLVYIRYTGIATPF